LNKGKNFFLMMLLALAAVFMFQSFFANKDKKQQPAETPTAAVSQPVAPQSEPVKDWFIKPAEQNIVALGSLTADKPYKMELRISATGACVESLKLANYFVTVADQRLYSKNPADYERLAAENPEKYKGHYQVLGNIDYGGHSYRSFETRQVNVQLEGQKLPYVFTEMRDKPWQLVKISGADGKAVSFAWTFYKKAEPFGKKVPALTITKTYTVLEDGYSVQMTLSLENNLKEPMTVAMEQAGPIGIQREDLRADMRMAVSAKLENDNIQPIHYGVKELSEWPYGQPHFIGSTTQLSDDKKESTPLVWFGMVNKYFGSMLYFNPDKNGLLAAVEYDADYFISPVQASEFISGEENGRVWDTSMWVKDLKLAPGKIATLNFDIFAGPKLYSVFKENPLYARLHYSDTIITQGCAFMTFNWLMELLIWLLTFFATHLFFGNYGLAIILLVLIVRVILHPLTKKGQVSMMKMQKQMARLKPELDKIKERCGNDKQRMQQETMKFYREHGNPMTGMLGCLPMVLQMPIWVALYSGLNTAVSLRHAAFLPVWITDLAAPDQLVMWSRSLPLIGDSFNLLPILLTVFMFLQQKYMTPPTSASMTPEQEQQQKMMKFMMPIMMLFIFYNMPSGLNLYIMTSSAVGLVEQIYIRRHIKRQEELEAARETIIDIGGKGPRSNRPKKPKNPFGIKF